MPTKQIVLLEGPTDSLTRRRAIAGVAIALASLAGGVDVFGEPRRQTVKEATATVANKTRTFLHQETDFKAGAHRIYEVLLDSKQFAAVTGMKATIDPNAGGSFTMFDGMIVGRNVELIPDQRIVQAWRPEHWNPGIYSIVKFELKAKGAETTIVLDHTGFPEGAFDGLDTGWPIRYWNPLKKFLA